ncbi:MAG: OsmC family protein [Desulfobacteraceae bacterium]|nr:OsmC family protein [Desulfobacteraceae bacterium]
MKFYMSLALLAMGMILFSAPAVFSGGPPAPYQIKVKSREVANRIVASQVRGHLVLSDQPKEFGADDVAPTPPEYLAVAYGTCVVSTLRFVAMLDKLDIKNIEAEVSGEIDFSKAMGIPTPNRAGFTGLTVKIRFDSAMSREEQQAFVDKAMGRGAVLDNVLNKTPVTYKVVK